MTALRQPLETSTRPATYQDVLNAPPHRVAEILAGTLHLQPRPAARHAWASSAIGAELHTPFRQGSGGPGGWWIVDEPELHLGEHILVPGIAGWRLETMPTYPDTAFFRIAPDCICEVLSPSTLRIELAFKRDAYAREQVSHLWLVDQDARTLEAFRPCNGTWSLISAVGNDMPVSFPPFEAINFPLGALWLDTPEDRPETDQCARIPPAEK